MCLPAAHYLELKLKCVFDQAPRRPLTCPGLLDSNLAINAGLSHHTAPLTPRTFIPTHVAVGWKVPATHWDARVSGKTGLSIHPRQEHPGRENYTNHGGLPQEADNVWLEPSEALSLQTTAAATSEYNGDRTQERGLQPSVL